MSLLIGSKDFYKCLFFIGVAIEFTFLIISGFVYILILALIEGFFEKIMYFFDSFNNSKNQNNGQQNALVYDVMSGQWIQKTSQSDSDVSDEKRRIEDLCCRGGLHEEAIVVRDLTKNFGKLIPIKSVNGLSFANQKERNVYLGR